MLRPEVSRILFWAGLCLIAACSKEEIRPEYQASASDIQGQWVIDQDAMKEAAGFNPLDRAAVALLKDTSFDIKAQTLTARLNLLGEQAEFSGNYKVTSVIGDTVIVQATSGAQAGQQWHIVFLDQDHMQLTGKPGQDEGEGMDLFMKRATSQ